MDDKQRPALIGDGWISLLPFLDKDDIDSFCAIALQRSLLLRFVCTQRDVESLIRSELQHWIIHNLEHLVQLSYEERSDLESMLRTRYRNHCVVMQNFHKTIQLLPIDMIDQWPRLMNVYLWHELIDDDPIDWIKCFHEAGHQNQNPELPLEAILLTLRLGVDPKYACDRVDRLLTAIEEDSLCRFMLVVALDDDEARSTNALILKEMITNHSRIEAVYYLTNKPRRSNEPFPICQIWNEMACVSYEKGADWVMLLGDDIKINCPFHYRAFYRSFLNISKSRGLPFGFGCPWWNDEGFRGFPTFPVVGKMHYKIFGSLIPSARRSSFVNQDLDPYLQRLYLPFGAAPLIEDAKLVNEEGGNHLNPTRYERVRAIGWKDWVMDDVDIIRNFLQETECLSELQPECTLLDVVVPTFRINCVILERFCMMIVPDSMRSVLIIIVDNPERLTKDMKVSDPHVAVSRLEMQLHDFTKQQKKNRHLTVKLLGENVRVRCNSVNLGASASRNRGLDESAAEHVLFLDDDVLTLDNHPLLCIYNDLVMNKPSDCVGFVGMVAFPRSQQLPVHHAAVLMSYLTFMFEIAQNPIYQNPAWGVTANILVKRTSIRFDTSYAKTGGGEDVDYCLRLLRKTGGQLYAAPHACVQHDFWSGGITALFHHFFNWAIGDGALFQRFPEHCYYSYPNVVETMILFVPIWIAMALINPGFGTMLPVEVMGLVLIDVLCEILDAETFRHRCLLLGEFAFPLSYYIVAHFMANIYVIILESGRFYGHYRRGEIVLNFARRFDWHCDRLTNSRRNFVSVEKKKFGFFLLVSVLNVISHSCLSASTMKLRRCN